MNFTNSSAHPLKIVALASIGGGLEMYDFSIYIFFSTILAHLFFSPLHGNIATLSTLLIFALGYFSRPIGALLFGHYGDTRGRKQGLLWTILLMALSSALIGCLPSYYVIGAWAPVLLILCRLLQGIAVGGDLPGAMTFVAEYASVHQRGLVGSIIYCAVNLGVLLATGLSALGAVALSSQAMAAWGWRLAFFLGALIAVLGFYLRRKIADTPYFQDLVAKRSTLKYPLALLFKVHKRPMLKSIALVWIWAVIIAQVMLYTPTYLQLARKMPLSHALILNSINVLIFALLLPFFGYLSDQIGRKRVLGISSGILLITAYPLYSFIANHNLMVSSLGLIILAILNAAIVAPLPAMLAEIFTTKIRYSGIGVAYNIGFAIFAGFSPLVATLLFHYGHHPAAVSYSLMLSALVALVALFFCDDLYGQPLPN